jgi:predicted DsbA family dithiol-disulfide isomerase
MPLVATLFLDVVCPYCALTLAALERVAGSEGLAIVARPFETHPETPPEGVDLGKTKNPRREDAFRSIAWMGDDLGVTLREPERLPNSRRALEGIEAARAAGGKGSAGDARALAFARAAIKAFFAEGRDLGDESTLRALGSAAGLDRDVLDRWLLGRVFSKNVDAARRDAEDRLVTAVPAGDVGGLPFLGHQSLAQARALAAKARARSI